MTVDTVRDVLYFAVGHYICYRPIFNQDVSCLQVDSLGTNTFGQIYIPPGTTFPAENDEEMVPSAKMSPSASDRLYATTSSNYTIYEYNLAPENGEFLSQIAEWNPILGSGNESFNGTCHLFPPQ